MKSIAYAMGAPYTHDAACKSCLAIPGEEFLASFPSFLFTSGVFQVLVFEVWILRSVSNLRHSVVGTGLKLKLESQIYKYHMSKYTPLAILALHPRHRDQFLVTPARDIGSGL